MTTNPIPKNGLFATLGMNAVAELIQSLPKKHQQTAMLIYFGTVNHCAEHVDKHLELHAHKDAAEYPAVTPTESEDGIKDIDRPVVTNRRPDW